MIFPPAFLWKNQLNSKRMSVIKKRKRIYPQKNIAEVPAVLPVAAGISTVADEAGNNSIRQKVQRLAAIKEPKPRCRFDMFVILKKDVPIKYNGSKEAWCLRGDKYSTEPEKMLKYLIGVVKNHHKNYYLMELYDNTLPKTDGDRLIFKLLNGVVKTNRLPNYAALLKDFHLPEKLSYEVTD